MSVVVYECDVCKREIQRSQNIFGLESVGRCVITDGCRGRLLQQEVKPSYAVGHSTVPVIGLTDWTPRKILFTHTQEIVRQRWVIEHNLNGLPIINAYVYPYGTDGKLIQVEPKSIEYLSNNSLALTFATSKAGVVQLIMRSSVSDDQITSLKPKNIESRYDTERFVLSESTQLTNGSDTNGELTIATRIATTVTSGFDPYADIVVQPYYLSPSTLTILPLFGPMTFKAIDRLPVDSSTSPWGGATKIVVQGHQYLLRSANIHPAAGALNTLGVPEGAPVFFTVTHKGSVRTVAKGEMLALLANAPYMTVDRILDKYVDMSVISQASAPKQMVYSDLNWRINPALLIKTYPDIITL